MKKPTNILIVEDIVADVDLAKHTIRAVLKDCEFQVVETRKDFLRALASFQPDVILADYSLPRFDGIKALKLALNHAPLTPVIIWTGMVNEDIVVDCMKAGANNYILKENIKRLGPAVVHALEERELLVARQKAEEALQNSEKRFRALIENGLDNISLLAADGTLLWESPATIRMLDYASDEFVGHNIFELVHPDDLGWTHERFTQLLCEPGSHQRGVFRLRHSNGTWRWVEAVATNMLQDPTVNAIVINYRDITESKQAEEALRESQAKYQDLVETSHDLIWSVDIAGKITFLNRAAKEIYGYEPEALIGHAFSEILDPTYYSPEDVAKFQETLALADQFKDVETYVRHRDGRQIVLSSNAIVIHDDAGNVIGVTGSSHDITERKQAEEALQASEARFRTLVNHATDAFFLHNDQGIILDVNRQACENLGYTREELIGLSPFDFDIELTASSVEQLQGRLEAGETVTFDTRYRRKDGTVFPADVRIRSFWEGGNRFSVSLVRDITERKQAEEKLRQSENRYRLATKATNDVIWEANLQTNQLFWSENAQSVFGYAPEEIDPPETWWDDHLHPEDRERVLSKLNGRIAGDEVSWSEEYRFRRKDGSYAYISDRGVIERDVNGTPLRMTGAMTDITERKRAEEGLRESENRLILALSGAQMSVWEWDLQNNHILWSPEFFEITGVKEEDFDKTFEAFTNLVHAEDATRLRAAAEKAMTEKTLFAEEFRIIRPDGEVRWLSNLGHAEYDSTKDHLRLIGTVQDITQRKQADTERQALLEVMQGVTSTKDLHELLKLIHHSIGKVIYAKNFFVVMYQPETGLFEEIYSVDQYDPPAPPAKLEKSITSYVFRSGEPLLLTQAAFDELAAQDEVKLVGTNSASWLGVPLKASGKTIGVIAVQDYENPNRYSEHDKEFLAFVAIQIALAVQRQQAEDALHKSEALYRRAIEVAGAVPYYETYDDEGQKIKYEFIGEGIRQITGYGPEEFSAKLWDSLVEEINLVDELAGYSLDEAIQQVRTGKHSIWKCEHRLRDREGKIHWVFEAAVELRDEEGISYGSVGMYQDITARKQAEEALREAETKYRTLVEQLPAVTYLDVIDEAINAGEFTNSYMSPQVEALLGYSPQAFQDDPGLWTRLIHSDDRERVLTRIAEYYKKLGFYHDEYRMLTGTGKEIWVRDEAIVVHAGDDKQPFSQGVVFDITERKQAEEELRASNERFNIVSKAVNEAVWDWNLMTNQVDWNDAIYTLFEYQPDEVGIDANWWVENIHPDDRENIVIDIHRAIDSGTVNNWNAEYRFKTADGSYAFIYDRGYILRDVSGKASRMIGAMQDITERKQAEIALLESITQFRTLFEASPDAIILIDPKEDWPIIDCNTAACQMNGYNRDELIGQPIDLLNVVPNVVERRGEYLESIRQAGVLHFEERHKRKDGTVFPVEVSTSLITLSGREVILGIDRDITQRKQAESELRASEERFRQLADNIQEVFWMTEAASGKEIYMSPAAEKIWGRSIKSLMHEPNAFIDSVYPEDRPVVLRAIENEKNGEKVEIEYRIVQPNGSLRWVWDRAFPIFDDSGKVNRIAGISADITERWEAEQALIKSQSRYRELFDNSPVSIWEEDFSLVKEQLDILLKSGISDLRDYLSHRQHEVVRLASLVKITDVNRASLELYGVEQKEILLTSLTLAVGKEALDHFSQEILGLSGPSRKFVWEGTDKTFDGRQIEIIVAGSIPQGYEEDWSKVIVSISDITERKRAEQALLKREQQLEEAQRLGHIGSWELDLQTEITTWSNEMYQLYDRDSNLHPFNIEEYIKHLYPEDKDRIMQILLQASQTHQPFDYECRFPTKNGKFRWLHVHGETVLDQSGQPIRVQGITQDITERKQGEIETHRHVSELEALYENGLAVSSLLKPSEIGNKVIETFAHYLHWHHAAIRLKHEQSDDLELVAFNVPSLSEQERSSTEQHFIARVNKVGQGLSGWVIQTGVPLRTGNVHTHSRYINTHPGIQSGLYMPLKVGERVIGVISVESEEPDAFSEQDERLLATLANQAAIAFENARLYQAIEQELLERKRAEEALRVSEVHYRELADSITDILFELDQNLQYTHWNKAFEGLTGIPAAEAIGKSMYEIFGTSEEQLRIGKIYEDVLMSRQSRTFETTILLNGEKHSFEINVYPSTRGVSVVAKDVTERKQTETIMQKRIELMEYSAHHSLNELMQRTVDEVSELTGSTIGFFHFVEEDGINLGMQTWSTNALRLFHVPLSEGTHLPLDRAGLWAEAVRQRHPLIQNDYRSLPNRKSLPQGHEPILREIVIPIIRNEKVVAVMGIGNKPQEYTPYDLEIAERLADYAWDVTERKQMEIALENERNQLAKRVDERTADLSQANSHLARALRVKDEFLANMSHELRTPLNAILGLSESLGEQIAGPLNEKQQKYITTISESGHHLLSLINDILDLAKIEAGQITLDINKVDIHSVCQASLRMIKQLAQKKHQEVFLQIDDHFGLMWADERRLKQMIVNLLGNAVKFTPENGKIGLEVHGDADANKVTITVWDSGIGIKEEDLERLFRPFIQLDSGLARESTGTGLGLALVAQMARLHGGSVSVVSEPEKGSRFSILLPWEPALALDTASRLRTTGKFRAIKPDETNKPTILLVEDTREVVMMVKDYLELAGYNIVTAQDGADAIVQAKLVLPDLILMDIQMPRMDGFEATRQLRSEPNFKDTPIIALTALAMPNDRERCLAAGMNEYISKPVNLKGLVKIIQSCLFDGESTAQ